MKLRMSLPKAIMLILTTLLIIAVINQIIMIRSDRHLDSPTDDILTNQPSEDANTEESAAEIASISDENFTLALERLLTSEHHTLAVISVTALHDEAAEELLADDFLTMDSFSLKPFSGSSLTYSSLALREIDDMAETDKRYWAITISNVSNPDRTAIILRPGFMDADPNRLLLSQETVVDTLDIRFQDETIGEVYIQLSPLGILIEKLTSRYDWQLGNTNVLFQMADGTVKTYNQLFSDSYGSPLGDWEDDALPYRNTGMARHILNLDQFTGIIIGDNIYSVIPPHHPEPIELDETYYPFHLFPYYVEGDDNEEDRFLLPVTEAFGQLGAELLFNEDGTEVTIRYRDTDLTVIQDRSYYLLNGKEVAAPAAPLAVDNILYVNGSILTYFNVGIYADTTRDFPDWVWYLLP